VRVYVGDVRPVCVAPVTGLDGLYIAVSPGLMVGAKEKYKHVCGLFLEGREV
jgi:hypothetical protein